MATLVTGEGNTLHIFLYGTVHHLIYTAVMAQVYYLGAAALQYAAHNINGSIVPIKQRSSCYKANFVFGLIWGNAFHKGNNWCTTNLTIVSR
jgi:hypothetical protein